MFKNNIDGASNKNSNSFFGKKIEINNFESDNLITTNKNKKFIDTLKTETIDLTSNSLNTTNNKNIFDISLIDPLKYKSDLIIKNPKILEEFKETGATDSNNDTKLNLELLQSNLNVQDTYIDETFDASKYQDGLDEVLNNTEGTKNKIAAAALYVATCLPKLKYFWGGGHNHTSVDEIKGIQSDWGQMTTCTSAGSENFNVGESYTNSVDCSGFVLWALVNGGYDISSKFNTLDINSIAYTELGENINITDENIFDKIELGDIAWMSGHVGIVVNIDSANKEVTIANVSGSGKGMSLTTMSTETGLITDNNLGALPSDTNIDDAQKIGNEYFTSIIHITE